MKKILLIMLIFMGAMIFSFNEVHASGDPGFEVYAFDGTETTHNISGLQFDDSIAPNFYVYVDGIQANDPQLFGTSMGFQDTYLNSFNVNPDGANDNYLYIMYDGDDVVEFHANGTITWTDARSVVIIVADDPDSFNAWGLAGGDGTIAMTSIDLASTSIYVDGVLRVENGVASSGYAITSIETVILRFALGTLSDPSLDIYNDGYFENLFGDASSYTFVIIEAVGTSSEPDTEGWTLGIDGYYYLDTSLPDQDASFVVTSPFGTSLEYKLTSTDVIRRDWFTAPSEITVDRAYVAIGSFPGSNVTLSDTVSFEDDFQFSLAHQYEFLIRTHPVIDYYHPDWQKNNDGWFYHKNPMPSINSYLEVTSNTGNSIYVYFENTSGSNIVRNWVQAPAILSIDSDAAQLGMFPGYLLTFAGPSYSDSFSARTQDTVVFKLRTKAIDQQPIISGQQYFTVSYASPVTEASIRSNIYAYDEVDGNITSSIVLVSNGYAGNQTVKGTYEIVYSVTDSSNNTSTVTVYVVVVDNIAPAVLPQFQNYVIYTGYNTFREVFDSAMFLDAYDGYFVGDIIFDDYTANYNVVGTYTRIYQAVDASGNVAINETVIHVVDNVAPVMTGPSSFTKNYNTILTTNEIKAQLTATDFIDGDLASSITVLSSTYAGKSNIPGTYQIVFAVSDAAGNTRQKTVTISVVDNVAPIWYVTNGFLLTVDEAVSLSTAQIITTLLNANYISSDAAANMYVIEDDYDGSTTLGEYDVVFGYLVNDQEVRTTVKMRVVRLQEEATSYTVIFNSNGGSFVPSIAVDEGSTITAPATPTRTGYTFAGWYTTSELTTLYNFSSPVTDDMTLHAKWTVTTGTVTPPPAETNPNLVYYILGGLGVVIVLFALIPDKKRYRKGNR